MKRRDFMKYSGAVAGSAFLLEAMPGAEAYAETAKSGGTLIWGHSETTQNIDMHQTGTASTGRVLENVHDAIVTVDHDFQLQPSLAESFEVSEDGLTYTFKLRPNVTFHNGKTMTSGDVKYSFERVKDPATGATNFEVFNDVDEIQTPDDLTVVVKMSKVNAPFLARLAENGAGVVIPEGSGDTQGEHPIGAGPFKFVSREFGNMVKLERFDDYWDEPAYLDEVIAHEVTEPTVRLTGLRTGEFHLINDIPMDRIREIEDEGEFQVLKWAPLSWAFVNFNHQREPFNDKRVRLAIDYMIDKEALVQGALWGNGEVSASPSFPKSPSRNNNLTVRPQDFDKARALLEEAGIAPGQIKANFKVTTNYPWHVEASEIMLEWFRQGGVEIDIQKLSWSDWLSQVWNARDFDMTMMNFFTLWEPDFLYYLIWHSTGAFNYRNIDDAVVDELADKARITIDREERIKIYHELQARMHEEALDVLLWFRNGTIAASRAVKGLENIVVPNASNLDFRKVWIDA